MITEYTINTQDELEALVRKARKARKAKAGKIEEPKKEIKLTFPNLRKISDETFLESLEVLNSKRSIVSLELGRDFKLLEKLMQKSSLLFDNLEKLICATHPTVNATINFSLFPKLRDLKIQMERTDTTPKTLKAYLQALLTANTVERVTIDIPNASSFGLEFSPTTLPTILQALEECVESNTNLKVLDLIYSELKSVFSNSSHEYSTYCNRINRKLEKNKAREVSMEKLTENYEEFKKLHEQYQQIEQAHEKIAITDKEAKQNPYLIKGVKEAEQEMNKAKITFNELASKLLDKGNVDAGYFLAQVILYTEPKKAYELLNNISESSEYYPFAHMTIADSLVSMKEEEYATAFHAEKIEQEEAFIKFRDEKLLTTIKHLMIVVNFKSPEMPLEEIAVRRELLEKLLLSFRNDQKEILTVTPANNPFVKMPIGKPSDMTFPLLNLVREGKRKEVQFTKEKKELESKFEQNKGVLLEINSSLEKQIKNLQQGIRESLDSFKAFNEIEGENGIVHLEARLEQLLINSQGAKELKQEQKEANPLVTMFLEKKIPARGIMPFLSPITRSPQEERERKELYAQLGGFKKKG